MRTLALMFLGVVVGWAAGGECHALNVTLLPRIPGLPASLGLGGGQTGATLGTAVQGVITITDPAPNPGIQTAFDAYSSPLGYVNAAPLGESSDGRAVAVGATAGFINSKAIARPGQLRAFAVAGGGGGSVTGVATATALFVDTVTLVTGNEFAIDWAVHGSVSGGYSILTPDVRPLTRPGAGAQMRAQVWCVPVGVNLAQAAQSNFLGSYYQDTSWVFDIETGEAVATTREIKPPGFGDAEAIKEPPGTKFWVVGLLEVTAARGAGSGGTVYPSSFVTGTADFMNTVEMTIESRSVPGQSGVTSFSGHDYSPSAVPETSTLAMLIVGGAAMLFRRRMAYCSGV
ncbi:PEP-CTERM sorting domain-containing protein [Roseateles toxinivorans]|uniref:Putative secreted protein with PEP-CTERM sorting signal n=1 Tax=Roseateles toxinivorans TaxID=270368 RepID=A0A4V3CT63_9BURK|nr:PEP-CTERM sorting domain-containing protein [Roseateles toxinivorans]TDP63964.1 putative secreted protein with PEP-CTERM sorting signal [Roseateles toxinivorans]